MLPHSWRWFNGTDKKHYWQQTAPSGFLAWFLLRPPTLTPGAKKVQLARPQTVHVLSVNHLVIKEKDAWTQSMIKTALS